MARTPRKQSESQFYHVMIRGNANRKIFYDDNDKNKLLLLFINKVNENAIELYAFCILNNHAHFIIKEKEQNLSEVMKRINIAYALYFNKKYNNVGHVFQDRFRSECIEDEKYLLGAIRYIHNNPIKVGLTNNLLDYKWSSYRHYIQKQIHNIIIQQQKILSLFSFEFEEALKMFEDFSKKDNNDIFLDIEESIDYKINKIIEKYIKNNNIKLCELGNKENIEHKIKLVIMIKQNSNYSIRKIADILQLNRGVVYRILTNYYNY